jgi:hypothetical protein
MVTNRARQEIIWISPKKLQKLLRRLAPLTFLIRVQAFWDPPRSREVPSCSAIDLAEIRQSFKIRQ